MSTLQRLLRLSSVLALGALSGCAGPEEETGASSTLAASSISDAYAHCGQVLAQGVYDSSEFKSDLNLKKYVADVACSQLAAHASDSEEWWSRPCGSTSSSSSGDAEGSLDVAIGGFGFGGGGGSSSSSSSSATWCNDAGSRSARRHAFYNSYCGSKTEDFARSEKVHQAISRVNDDVVEAWRSCVQQRNYGMACSAKEQGDGTLYFDVAYDRGPFGAIELALKWAVDNVKAVGDTAVKMGEGNLGTYFKIQNAHAPALLTVRGEASSFQTTCAYHVAPKPEGRVCKADGKAYGSSSNSRAPDFDRFCPPPAAAVVESRSDSLKVGTTEFRVFADGYLAKYSNGQKVGFQEFGAARPIRALLYVEGKLLVAAGDLLVKIDDLGGTGSNMFAIDAAYEGSLAGYSHWKGSQTFVEGTRRYEVSRMSYSAGKLTVALWNGPKVIVKALGGTGRNMFALKEPCKGLQGYDHFVGCQN